MKSFILMACLLQTALAAPQLISFKDGKVGVNFFGYHAEAGLGGGQNDGLIGGLHASAGTPWGQNAAAGLGGNVNGRAAGMLYAGAQATPDVGAGAVLGGDTSRGGFSGSEAYANGKVASRTRTLYAAENTQQQQHHDDAGAVLPPQPVTENVNAIQKIRPPKKYYSSERYDFPNSDNNNNGIALYTNKTKNIYDIEQQKPFIAKSINKTTISTPFQTTAKGVKEQISIEAAHVATHETKQPLSTFIKESLTNDGFDDDGDDNIDRNHHQHHNYQNHNNAFIELTSPATAAATSSPPTSLSKSAIISSVSLSHLNDKDNFNGYTVAGDGGLGEEDKPTIIITRDRKTLDNRHHPRNHQHHPYHHRRLIHRQKHPKRIHLNQQQHRQRSKTIVKVLEQEQQKQQQPTANYHQQPEELLFIDPQQNYPQHKQRGQQQQVPRPVRRQLIAPPPAPPCDVNQNGCVHAEKNVRADMVQNALQIPIGILQSLQNSFGNFGNAPAKGH